MKHHKFLLIACCLWTAVPTFSKETRSITLPPQTVEGFLPNGLHYIIRQNDLPKHNVECRLVIKAGSIQERNHQKGGAHFLEHMAFNGSTHFPGSGLVDYFERQGMKYGRDINAFTGFDRTIYWFSLPADNAGEAIVDSTLLAMGDILCHLTIDAERTKKERGIILEELRGYTTNDNFYDLKIGRNRYSGRMPLGTADDINSISRETLVEFYNQWYSPAVSTVIVAGNVDPSVMEQKIKATMGDLPTKGARRPALIPLDYSKGLKTMRITDNLQHNVKMDVMIPHATIFTCTLNDCVRKARLGMLTGMLERRLQQRQVRARVDDSWYLADKNHLAVTLEGTSEEVVLEQLTAVADELQLLSKQGPEEEELQYSLNRKLKQIRPEYTDKLSSIWCDDFIDHAILGDKRVYDINETAYIKECLERTTVNDMRREARQLLKAAGRTMLVGILDSGEDEGIDESRIRKAWRSGKAEQGSRFVQPEEKHEEEAPSTGVPALLAEKHPYDSRTVVERKHYDNLGLDELRLSNGATILLRPTLYDDHRISINAFARGAAADVPDSLFLYYKDVAGYVDMAGITTVDADTLGMIMAERGLMMNIGVGNHWHQIMATSPREEAQILMNLVYEKMHHPAKDEEGFAECIEDEIKSLGKETTLSQMMKRDYRRIIDNLADSLFGNSLPAQYQPYTEETLRRLSIDDITEFYKQMFTDPSHLYILITGNFRTDSIAGMAVATFARMQVPENALTLRNEPFVLPQQGVREKFPNEEPSQTSCNCIFAQRYEPSLKNSLMFKLMRDILQNRLLSVLREQHNIVYSPFVESQCHGVPQQVAMFRLYIDVKNENFDKMLCELEKIIETLRNTPVEVAELEKMKRSFIVTKRQTLTDTAPTEWTRVLTELLQNGETLADYDAYNEVLDSITPDDVMQGFRRFIDFNKLVLLYQSK